MSSLFLLELPASSRAIDQGTVFGEISRELDDVGRFGSREEHGHATRRAEHGTVFEIVTANDHVHRDESVHDLIHRGIGSMSDQHHERRIGFGRNHAGETLKRIEHLIGCGHNGRIDIRGDENTEAAALE